MSEIEWLYGEDGTRGKAWNPITGCSPASAGCLNCYAAAIASREMCEDHRGLTRKIKRRNEAGRLVTLPVFNGTIHLHRERLREPIGWKKPRRVFVNSMSDLFHPDVPFAFIAQIYGIMAECPQHTFLVLTKRAARAREFYEYRALLADLPWPSPNVQVGISAEDQPNWDARLDDLLACDTPSPWVSVEPMIGPIDMRLEELESKQLKWIVVGGESGPGARVCDAKWIQSIVAQCDAAKIPVFVKQLGRRPLYEGRRIPLVDKKGGDPHEWTGRLASLSRRELVAGAEAVGD